LQFIFLLQFSKEIILLEVMESSDLYKNFKGKRVLVMGLGRFGGGIGVSKFLAQEGAHVKVTDLAGEDELTESIKQLAGLNIEYHLGGHREEDFAEADLIVVNPAVHKDSPWLKVAREHKVRLTSEMNIFFALCPTPIIGVTGSNGKSTTTAMIGEILKASRGKANNQQGNSKVWVGGNIGQGSLLARIKEISRADIVVLELSSFQLYDLGEVECSPHIAVVTNIAPNHLDWHGSMKEYINAKQNIFRFQNQNDYLVLNSEDEELKKWGELTDSKVVWYPEGDRGLRNREYEIEDIKLKVPGRHNRMNAAAALAAVGTMGLDLAEALKALEEYAGLEHRLEFVGEIEGVRYYNDSIATTPESAIAALESFNQKKIMILGGYDKKIPFEGLVKKIAGEVEAVVLIGEVRDTLADLIERERKDRKERLPVWEKADTLEQAVSLCREYAKEGMVVLFSPGCASYDMFRNFQERGEKFKGLVNG